MNPLTEDSLTVIAKDIEIAGKIKVYREMHLYGKITGEVLGETESLIHFKEGSRVEGIVIAHHLVVEGYLQGDVTCRGKLTVLPSGKVIGSVKATHLQVEPGAIFETKIEMN